MTDHNPCFTLVMYRSCHSSGPWETANIAITGGCYNSSIFHRIAGKCFILHQPRETFLWRCHTMDLSCLQKWVFHICWVQYLWQLVSTLELPVWSWYWVFFFQNFRTCHILVLGPLKNLDHFQRCSVCNPAKYFSHPSVVIYFFPTPPIKLKLGLQMGASLLIANHLDQLL